MQLNRISVMVGVVCAVFVCDARADDSASEFRLSVSEEVLLTLQDDATVELASPARFGNEDDVWLTLGAGWALIFHEEDNYTQIFASASWFLSEDFEFVLEGGLWYFAQDGPDGLGVSALLDFRWHFTGDESPARRWTTFAELGVGIVAIDEDVPDTGGDFNFLPRAGIGFTRQLGSSRNRLIAGVRWQHLSNGRLEGGDNNPGRDGVMVHVGVMIPF